MLGGHFAFTGTFSPEEGQPCRRTTLIRAGTIGIAERAVPSGGIRASDGSVPPAIARPARVRVPVVTVTLLAVPVATAIRPVVRSVAMATLQVVPVVTARRVVVPSVVMARVPVVRSVVTASPLVVPVATATLLVVRLVMVDLVVVRVVMVNLVVVPSVVMGRAPVARSVAMATLLLVPVVTATLVVVPSVATATRRGTGPLTAGRVRGRRDASTATTSARHVPRRTGASAARRCRRTSRLATCRGRHAMS